MLHNNKYNLVHQLVQENKSLWRIKNMYLKDAEGNDEVLAFWKKIEKDKEDHVTELTDLVKKYL